MSMDTPSASETLAKGCKSFIERQADAMGFIDQAISLDPENSFAKIVKALALCGGRSAKFTPAIDALIADAESLSGRMDAKERLYLKAAQLTRAARPTEAVAAYEEILAIDPTDMLALSIVQQDLFWLGEASWMREMVLRCKPAFSQGNDNYSAFLSTLAFALEEAGDRIEAEKAGRAAVELNKNDPWGAHAVAHVLIMQGRIEAGINWLEPLSANWGSANQIAHHLWWHLALFLLEKGEHDRILELLDTRIRDPESPMVKALPDAYIDLQNVAALLTRLELRGVDIGDRWETIKEPCRGRIGDLASPFTNAHAALALAACGEFDAAENLVEEMRQAETSPFMRARINSAAIPASIGAIAHRKGDYQAVIDALHPARYQLWQMGGSHAQRDVFIQMLFDAAMKLNRTDIAAMVLDAVQNAGFEKARELTLYADAA